MTLAASVFLFGLMAKEIEIDTFTTMKECRTMLPIVSFILSIPRAELSCVRQVKV